MLLVGREPDDYGQRDPGLLARRSHRAQWYCGGLRVSPMHPPSCMVFHSKNNQQRREHPVSPRINHTTQTRSLRSRSRIDWAVEAARRVRGGLVAGL
eukprot:scaffold28993_cov34-Phaeocystis_antarctica.AAC.5